MQEKSDMLRLLYIASEKIKELNHIDDGFKKLWAHDPKEFLRLCCEEIHAGIRWSEPVTHKKVRVLTGYLGNPQKEVDALLEVVEDMTGEKLLLHVEFQTKYSPADAQRMEAYHHDLLKEHQVKKICPIIVYACDVSASWTGEVREHIFGKIYRIFLSIVVKLRRRSWREMLAETSYWSLVVMATCRVKKKDRLEWREEFIRKAHRMTIRNEEDAYAYFIAVSLAEYLFQPTKKEDEIIKERIRAKDGEEVMNMHVLMPAWQRWGMEEGLQQGLTQGLEQGLTQGLEQGRVEGQKEFLQKMLQKGMSVGNLASLLDMSEAQVQEMITRM